MLVLSGLRAAGSGMGVVGDNIANAGTTGFKASRAEFQDMLQLPLVVLMVGIRWVLVLDSVKLSQS